MRSFRLPQRYSHFLFGVIQSGLTTGISAAIASLVFLDDGTFVSHWLASWAVAWLVMLPIVLLAAPLIRRMVAAVTGE